METVREESSPDAKSPILSEDLTWKHCGNLFDDPITLPCCSKVICRGCVRSNKYNKDKNHNYNTVVHLPSSIWPFCKEVLLPEKVDRLPTNKRMQDAVSSRGFSEMYVTKGKLLHFLDR